MRPSRDIAGILSGAFFALAAGAASADILDSSASPLPVDAEDDMTIRTNGHVVLVRRDGAAKPHIDGRLDEDVWQGLEGHDDFRLIDPDTLAPAPLPTRVYMFYTQRGFYLGVEMVQDAETLVEHLSGRDQGWLNRDYFSFTLDTSGEGRYGFWFQLNLGNSISDGTILPERQFSDSWDGAWHGATTRTDEGWSAEYFIPWALVNMPKANGARTVGIFAQRNVAHTDERYAWPPLPWTKPQFLSAFQPLALRDVSPRQQYSATPYVSASYDGHDGGVEPKAGVDVLWRPVEQPASRRHAESRLRQCGSRRCGGESQQLRDLLSREAAVLSGRAGGLHHQPAHVE